MTPFESQMKVIIEKLRECDNRLRKVEEDIKKLNERYQSSIPRQQITTYIVRERDLSYKNELKILTSKAELILAERKKILTEGLATAKKTQSIYDDFRF